MNIREIYSRTRSYLPNILGWHTRRKIVVVESDDWGSIRMPSREVYNSFLDLGVQVDQNPYTRYDSLESNDDLTALFDVLSSVKDQYGRFAQLTANTIMANPDFERINDSNYQTYFYERLDQTLNTYPSHDQVFDLYQQGLKAGLYYPQLHGREHLNVVQWLKELQRGHPILIRAFLLRSFGVIVETTVSKRNNFMAALDYETVEEEDCLVSVISEAADLFASAFGYRSQTFIAPCYVWGGSKVEENLVKVGIKGLQGISYQFKPLPGSANYDRRFHYTGELNKYGQVYLTRNAFFEPSLSPNGNSVNECLKRVEIAFSCYKPAIIGSHRLNFIGSIDPKNRESNLGSLKELLRSIVKRWPNVEFLNSAELQNTICGSVSD